MPLTEEDEQSVDRAMQIWRQGDVCLDDGLEFLHLADLSRPHSAASVQVAEMLARNDEDFEAGGTPVLDKVLGMAVLSQTCDVVRGCQERLIKKHHRQTDEGAHLRALREIRVRAAQIGRADRHKAHVLQGLEGFQRVSQFFRRGRHGLVLSIGFYAVSFVGFYAERIIGNLVASLIGYCVERKKLH